MFEIRKGSGSIALLTTVALLGGTAAACSSKKSPSVVGPPSVSTSSSTQTATTPAATAGSTGSASKGAPSVTITPASGLKSGQVVQVQGTGFSPNEPLVINECADKGETTGPGDCNLEALVPTVSDAAGKVLAQFTVNAGPFGANHILCGGQQACLLSVSQATPSPTEEADVPLGFG